MTIAFTARLSYKGEKKKNAYDTKSQRTGQGMGARIGPQQRLRPKRSWLGESMHCESDNPGFGI